MSPRRLLLLPVLSGLLAGVAAQPAVRAAASTIPSTACAGGTVLDGYAGDVSLTLQAVQPDAQDVWICVAVDNGSWLHAGGRLRLSVPSGGTLPLPVVDRNAQGCSVMPGNQLPGPHPLLSAAVGGEPVLLDAVASAGQAVVCVSVGGIAARVLLDLSQVAAPPVAGFEPDPPGSQQPPLDAPPPVPSGTCQAATGAQRIADMHLPGGERVWVYTAPAADGGTDVCAGIGGTLLAFGGRLHLSGDVTPLVAGNGGCTVQLLSVSSPEALSVGITAPGSVPQAVCIGVVGVEETVIAGNNLPPSWVPDPGTP
jgi:hypothetical protein